jgi:hypothetical protein
MGEISMDSNRVKKIMSGNAKNTDDERAMRAIAEYIDASNKNAKDPDETWAAGFKTVGEKIDALHEFFSKDEVTAILVNSNQIGKVLREAGLLRDNNISELTVSVPYISVWGRRHRSRDIRDGRLENGRSDRHCDSGCHRLEVCERQYIILNGEQVDVYEDEAGYDYWADIAGIYNN